MEFTYYNKREYEQIKQKITELISNGINSFVIYPYGNVSEMARKIIIQLNGNIAFFIDNYKNNGVDIYSINEAKTKAIQNELILICSTGVKFYDEIRNNIYNAFPREKIVDLFPEETLVDCISVSDEKIISDIKYFDDFLNEVEKDESN